MAQSIKTPTWDGAEAGAECRHNESREASTKKDSIGYRCQQRKMSVKEQPETDIEFACLQFSGGGPGGTGLRDGVTKATATDAYLIGRYRVDACLRVEVVHG
jgi:hypothetical protein